MLTAWNKKFNALAINPSTPDTLPKWIFHRHVAITFLWNCKLMVAMLLVDENLRCNFKRFHLAMFPRDVWVIRCGIWLSAVCTQRGLLNIKLNLSSWFMKLLENVHENKEYEATEVSPRWCQKYSDASQVTQVINHHYALVLFLESSWATHLRRRYDFDSAIRKVLIMLQWRLN